jgi:hypothetical protein
MYIFDSGPFITIRHYPEDLSIDVLNKLEELFVDGHLISHRIVYDELTNRSKTPDMLFKKIQPLKKYFLPIQCEQAQIVTDIVAKFPKLINWKAEQDQADPWLIAIAILKKRSDEKNNPCLITNESLRKLEKIPDVCKYYQVKHLTLNQFYKKQKWQFRLNRE